MNKVDMFKSIVAVTGMLISAALATGCTTVNANETEKTLAYGVSLNDTIEDIENKRGTKLLDHVPEEFKRSILDDDYVSNGEYAYEVIDDNTILFYDFNKGKLECVSEYNRIDKTDAEEVLNIFNGIYDQCCATYGASLTPRRDCYFAMGINGFLEGGNSGMWQDTEGKVMVLDGGAGWVTCVNFEWNGEI